MPDTNAPKPDIFDLLRKQAGDHLGKTEFLKAYEHVVTFVHGIDKRLTDGLSALAARLTTQADNLDKRFDQLTTQLKGQVNSIFVAKRLDEITATQQEAIQRLDARVATIKDGQRGSKGDQGKRGVPGANGSPDTAEVIRNKLQSLKDDDRLDISAIKGLEKLEKRLSNVEKQPTGGYSAAAGGRITKYYDLSPSLDGLTTTFALPAFFRVLLVLSSSTPTPMRENVDYTIDGSLMKITFTSQVDAPTALAQPQTLLILYAEI